MSRNECAFNKAAPPYQEALSKSGYKSKLKCKADENKSSTESTERKRIRKRNITWFNPAYSKNVTTNIGQNF